MLQKEGDIPQNVNFAIKASVAATFLQSNNVKFASVESLQTMEPPDLADLAKALSVFVIVDKAIVRVFLLIGVGGRRTFSSLN
jgi:serine protease Do